MQSTHTTRSIAQRARRDAEREATPRPGPPSIPHGTPIGRVVVELHGQRVEAVLLQAGERCCTYGVSIDGAEPVLMGLYQAAVRVTERIARVPSRRVRLLARLALHRTGQPRTHVRPSAPGLQRSLWITCAQPVDKWVHFAHVQRRNSRAE